MIVVLAGAQYGGVWGRGDTLKEALTEARRQGGVLRRGYTKIQFGPDSEFLGVDSMGYVHWKGVEPGVEHVGGRP